MFPMTAELRRLLKAQHVEHERLKKAGQIVPQVFFAWWPRDAAASARTK